MEMTGNMVNSSPLTIQRASDVRGFDDLRADWDAVLTASDAKSVFLSWEMLRAWWDSYGKNHELLLLSCTDAAGNLIAIAPMIRTRAKTSAGVSVREVRLIGDLAGGAEKLDWIVRKGREEEVVPAILDWMERKAPKWDIFHYNTVRPDSVVAQILLRECARRKWHMVREDRRSFFVSVPDDWPAFLAARSKKMRQIVPQRVRRAEKTFKVRARRCGSLETLQNDLNALFALHAKRWQKRGESGNLFQPEKQRFYFEAASRCLDRGWLDFWLLDFNDQPVAGEFGFSDGEVYFNLQQGFDPEFASYGAGVVLRVAIIQDLIRRGIHGYDFMLGEEEYKERWGGLPSPLMFVAVARPRSLGATVLKTKAFARRAKDGIRARAPRPLLNLIRKLRGGAPVAPQESQSEEKPTGESAQESKAPSPEDKSKET